MLEPAIQSTTSPWSAVNLKKKLTFIRSNLSPRYGHVILVSGYLFLTMVLRARAPSSAINSATCLLLCIAQSKHWHVLSIVHFAAPGKKILKSNMLYNSVPLRAQVKIFALRLAFNSPGILANQKSQPITNCNRKNFYCFKSRVMSPTTYQKSRRIEVQEDKKITSLMW